MLPWYRTQLGNNFGTLSTECSGKTSQMLPWPVKTDSKSELTRLSCYHLVLQIEKQESTIIQQMLPWYRTQLGNNFGTLSTECSGKTSQMLPWPVKMDSKSELTRLSCYHLVLQIEKQESTIIQQMLPWYRTHQETQIGTLETQLGNNLEHLGNNLEQHCIKYGIEILLPAIFTENLNNF